MSDSKLRELERRWRETRSADDEASYLRERVRVGELSQERLDLAAYCGHEGARRAAGVLAGGPSPETWLTDLERRDRAAGLFAAVMLGGAVLPIWEAAHPADNRPRHALRAAALVLANDAHAVSRAWNAADDASDAAVESERAARLEVASAAACISAVTDLAAGAWGSTPDVWECALGALPPADLPSIRAAIEQEIARRLLEAPAGLNPWAMPEAALQGPLAPE